MSLKQAFQYRDDPFPVESGLRLEPQPDQINRIRIGQQLLGRIDPFLLSAYGIVRRRGQYGQQRLRFYRGRRKAVDVLREFGQHGMVHDITEFQTDRKQLIDPIGKGCG